MKIENRDVFEKIGNLFYAIAADQKIKPMEVGELKMLVSDDWLPRSSSPEHITSEESHCLLMAIDTLLAENTSSAEAYRTFVSFYSVNEPIFTKELRERIYGTAERIVNVFNGGATAGNVHFKLLGELFRASASVKV